MEGRTTEVAFAELGGDFNIETLVDQSSIGGVAGLKTVEAGGMKVRAISGDDSYSFRVKTRK